MSPKIRNLILWYKIKLDWKRFPYILYDSGIPACKHSHFWTELLLHLCSETTEQCGHSIVTHQKHFSTQVTPKWRKWEVNTSSFSLSSTRTFNIILTAAPSISDYVWWEEYMCLKGQWAIYKRDSENFYSFLRSRFESDLNVTKFKALSGSITSIRSILLHKSLHYGYTVVSVKLEHSVYMSPEITEIRPNQFVLYKTKNCYRC